MYKLATLQALSANSPALSTDHNFEPSAKQNEVNPPFREASKPLPECSTASSLPSRKEVALNAASDAPSSSSMEALVNAAAEEETACPLSCAPFVRVRRMPARALLRYLPPEPENGVGVGTGVGVAVNSDSDSSLSSGAPAGALALAAALRELGALAARESSLGARGYVMDAPHTVAMCHRTLQVGSGPDCDLCLPQFGYCARVSQHHATIFFDEACSYKLQVFIQFSTRQNLTRKRTLIAVLI